MTEPVLPFTGERFTPECVREIAYEHWHRYAFALPLARGRRVLDAACGEGFGSALLAGVAAEVMGVDIDASSIAHARTRYGGRSGLRFEPGDVTALDGLDDGRFDLIVSYETLEHVQAQERMLDGFVRLLAPGGLLLVSTPDRRTTTDATGVVNPHHVRELYREQFEALLAARFPAFRLYGQKLAFVSLLRALDDGARGVAESLHDGDGVRAALDLPPSYYLAVCARDVDALARLPHLAVHSDAVESIYRHYQAEIRNGIHAAERIAALERELATLEARLAARSESGP